MNHLPGPPAAPAAGQTTPTDADRAQAARWLAALDELGTDKPTSVRVDDPTIPSHQDGPRIGTTPPVQQPGRAAMSQKATDDSVRMISFGSMALLTCGGISLVMVTSDAANWTAIGAFFGGLGFLTLAAARLLRRAGETVPGDTHHHYNAPVHQTSHTTTNKTSGVWAKTNHQQ